MDKNTLTGLVLMGVIIFGFMWINNDKQKKAFEEQQAQQEQAEAAATAATTISVDTLTAGEVAAVPSLMREVGAHNGNDSTANFNYATETVNLSYNGSTVSGTVKAADTIFSYETVVANRFTDDVKLPVRNEAVANLRAALNDASRYGSFARYRNGKEQTVTLKNSKLAVDLSSHGGYISRAVLADYQTYLPENDMSEKIDTANVEVCRQGYNRYSFELTSASRRFNTAELYFTPVQVNDSTVEMTLDLGDGATWGLRYTLPEDSYVVKMEVVQKNMQKIIPSSVATAAFSWTQKMGRNERGRTFEERNSNLAYKYVGDTPDNIEVYGDNQKSKELSQRLKWIGFKNQFFSMVMIPRTNFSSANVSVQNLAKDPTFVKDFSADAVMDYSSNDEVPVTIDIFMGPNLYPLLDNLDKQIPGADDESLDLTRLIPLGWSFFRWVNTLVIIPLFDFLSSFISSYGLIIFLITLFIKLVLFPLTYKSYKSQARMRLLAPEIKAINEKYPGQENAMVRNQKTMELYSRAGASPMAGCLPMLLQMPILVAVFWFFPSEIQLRGEHFLWAKDLSAPDVIFTLPFSIPWYGNHVSLFCLLMTATNIIYTRINMQNQPSSSSMPGMKWMMYLMPVMFLFIFNDYASGLSYYYFLSLLITIVQTYIVRLCTNEEKIRQQMKANAAKPKKKSGWMARLEEAQRQQQAILREQQKQQKRK
jgi:YidC/Oxa1 family membrane protein insertase